MSANLNFYPSNMMPSQTETVRIPMSQLSGFNNFQQQQGPPNTVIHQSTRVSRIIQIVLDIVVTVAILVVLALVYFLTEPKIRYFPCNQSDIFMPYKADVVPAWAVAVYGIIGTVIFIIIVELINARLF